MSRNLEDRLKLILAAATADTDAYGRWKRLENLTGISAARWKNVNAGTQRPAPDMVEAIATLMPQYAFWLATGISDPRYGHVAPGDEGYPAKGEEQPASTRYFRATIVARKAADSAVTTWLKDKLDTDASFEAAYPGKDRLRRAVVNLPHVHSEALSDAYKRMRLTASLRSEEIGVYQDMPELDYDETEAVLRSIKRTLLRVAETSMAHGMGDEFEAVQTKIRRLDEMILRYRTVEAMLDGRGGAELPSGSADSNS